MATLAERLVVALRKAAQSGKRLAEAEHMHTLRQRGETDSLFFAKLQEWKGDCRAVADLIKICDETQALFGEVRAGEVFQGARWRRNNDE